MPIRPRTWIVLGIFAAFLAGALWWTRSRPTETTEALDLTPAPETLWSGPGILRIRLSDLERGQIVDARRDPEHLWYLELPSEGPADTARLERAVTWLAAPRPVDVIPNPGDLGAFQLTNPRATIIVYWEDGNRRTIEVGRDAPTGDAAYIRLPGDPNVYLVSTFGLNEVLGLLDEIPYAPPTLTPLPEVLPETTPTPAS